MHHDPVTRIVVYVGRGTGSRAFLSANSNGNNSAYGNRCRAHAVWMDKQFKKGFTMLEIVKVPHRLLSLSESIKKETELILKHMPRFNKLKGSGCRTDKKSIRRAMSLRRRGFSYSQIGREMKTATMTAWRHVKHGNK
jgi:hypothetical protein